MPSTIDTVDSNTLSELENLSDSDWLDIASSRASEDTDSIAGFDSDPEDSDGRPSSRRSFNSVGSSRDGEIQGWEGLVEDSADESPTQHYRLPSDILPPSARLTALDDATQSPNDEDPAEEQRVKDALDQSMMSTLSSSRSNSLNEYPSPLNIDPPEPNAEADTQASGNVSTTSALPLADPGSLTIPVIPEEDTSNVVHASISPDFYITLYGSSSSMKWSLVETILEKIAYSAGLSLSPKLVAQAVESRQGERGRIVSVIDRTELLKTDDPIEVSLLQRPSVPEHTLYLPVLAQNFTVVDLPYSPDQLLDAEQQWELLGIPRTKRAVLSRGSSSVIDQEELERARPLQVCRAFQPLLDRPQRRIIQRRSSTHAFTIFAVLSIVLGCVLNGSFTGVTHTPTVTTPTVVTTPHQEQQPMPPPLWGLLRPVNINQSVPPPTISTALPMPSSLKSFALAVLNPAPLVASTSTPRESAPAHASDKKAASADAPSECVCGCDPHGSRLRPTPPSPALTADDSGKAGLSLTSLPQTKGKGKAFVYSQENLHVLTTFLFGSLSQYVDVKAIAAVIAAVVGRDMQEILDAIDELVHAISRQTVGTWEQSKATVDLLREKIQARHGRAQQKARELKEFGGRLLSSGLRKRVVPDMWSGARVQREEALRARKMGRERRMERREKLRRVFKF
ncbi:hypothetical protein B0H21DRAFT_725212 [Amylocystis lapponica]|nr:hypothetical protein B0H21DRAFT_725212 [Amylocystis lapponica]